MSRPDHSISLPAWKDFIARHAAGGTFEGLVTSVVPFGAFVEVAEGIHGLLPQSAWSARPEAGASISVRIASIDVENRRVSLVSG
jgi:small subunit ribosomal protein S1